MTILEGVMLAAVAFGTLVFASWINEYNNMIHENSVKVSFDTFKAWYSINPDRYKLEYYEAIVKIGTGNDDVERIQMNSAVSMSRYHKFLKDKAKREGQVELTQRQIRVLETVQIDIGRYKEKAKEECNKALDMQVGILNKMGGNVSESFSRG